MGGRYGTALLAALGKPPGPEDEDDVLQFVQLLIEHGADINLAPVGYLRSLARAGHNGFSNVVRLLLESGAKVQTLDEVLDLRETAREDKVDFNRTTFHLSILSRIPVRYPRVYEILLSHGAPAQSDSTEEVGMTLLECACNS